MFGRHRKDLDLYHLDSDAGRGYVYTGQYWHPPVQQADLPLLKVLLLAVSIAQLGLIYLMGRLNLPSMRTLYVVLPFLLLLFFTGRAALAAAAMFGWKQKMTFNQHTRSWKRVGQSGLLATVAGGVLLIGQVVFLVWGTGQLETEWPMLLLILTSILVSAAIWRVMHSLPCWEGPLAGRPFPVETAEHLGQ